MKNTILTLLSLACSLLALAQNTPPTLSIQDAQIDPAAQQATLVYDLSDAEQQACEVWLKVSLDGGQFYTRLVRRVMNERKRSKFYAEQGKKRRRCHSISEAF